MKKKAKWVLGFALLIGLQGCERTQHSKVKEPNDWYTECVGSPLTAEQEATIRLKIDATHKVGQIEEIFRKKRLSGFNGNVLIAQKGVVLYEKSFGYSHLRDKDTLRSQHAFQLASLSKPFTAVAILKLYEAKKVRLEDSIQHFFPDFPYRAITIKDLLCHRSGLPNYTYAFMDSVRHGKKYPSNLDVMRWFATVKPTPVPYNRPNRSFNYSNTNYLVLAAIVEKVSGVTFEAYLQKQILAPLGMTHTFLNTNAADSTLPFRTVGHQYGREVPKDYYDEVVGDKGLYSTTGDLYRFYKGLTANCLLSRKTMREAFSPRSFERKGMKNYGYGFRMHLDEREEARYIYHGGWWKGYNTMMWMNPADDFIIIILSNSYNRSVYQIKELLDILHGQVQTDDIEKDL
ncbi:serine hydrolase domain-containing protein [Arundinibacter roseus]|uniref:Class A beta-lactamase-related serine hydrolase n=1 Tax=Arundinibacter roseus TaxID=2070510 RepID=A0A4R4KPX9_9BACT|nr:serine hydrolase domain-containing protein [Arundinibacter roseus]TDB68952.1 class A beta-lactamase-related serine hydrolase [Arundinibacter roseus]